MAGYQVKVLETGEQFVCNENEMVLEAMRRTRTGPVQYGCYGGGCGVCKMRIVDGEFEVAKKMSRSHISQQEEQDGFVLLCCVKPRGNITVSRV